MKIMLITMLSLIFFDDLNKIAMINRLKKEAEIAYNENRFGEAAEKYRILVDSLGLDDEKIMLNLSHCYFNLKDTTSAYSQYRSLTASTNPALRSVANQQLGILNTISGRYDEAEENFKEALRANPGNEDARYNYELLRKRMSEQQSQNKQQNQENKEQQENNKKQDQQSKGDDQQSQDQQKKEDQGQKNENKEGKKNEEQARQQESQSDDPEKPEESRQMMKNQNTENQKISEEKAKMILEAMRNAEEQYLQQMRRRPTKRPESGKPDW